jgi:hypothetical protein
LIKIKQAEIKQILAQTTVLTGVMARTQLPVTGLEVRGSAISSDANTNCSEHNRLRQFQPSGKPLA